MGELANPVEEGVRIKDIMTKGPVTLRADDILDQKDLLKAIRIDEVMNRPVTTISPDATVREAARIMLERKIGCLPVVEGESLVGLVTETDILRYVVNLREA